MSVTRRLEALRERLRARGLTHYLIPSSDEHLGEYPPAWRLRRQWLSGFTGSAGDLLVGLEPAETWLFTDGRYHLQAAAELAGTGIGLQKVGTPQGKSLETVLRELAGAHGDSCVVGYDPAVVSMRTADAWEGALADGEARLQAVGENLVDALWAERPQPAQTPVWRCPPEWTTRGVADKVAALRGELQERNADATIAVQLDQVAWLTNLRAAGDVAFNPVFEAFCYVEPGAVHLFLHGAGQRLPADYGAAGNPVRCHEHEEFLPFLRQLDQERVVLVDPVRTTRAVQEVLQANPRLRVVRGPHPLEKLKAVKDAAELRCMARASLLASVAKVRALLWLEAKLAAGRLVTERSFAAHLEALYAELPGFRQLSFPTIAASGEHGAIVHYTAADETPLRAGDLFLVDSGIQLDGGTTDDTRTVIVGHPTAEQLRAYTHVLRGHIAGARQRFPEGATGAALDAVTRAPLWTQAMDYGHGTGHGVGAFLNVHEGPFALAEAKRPGAPGYGLAAGMVTSIEPGFYRSGFGGIRLESLYRIAADGEGADGRPWLRFVPLTWIPFERRLIDRDLLAPADLDWLDSYHSACLERLTPHLTGAELQALDASLGHAVAG